MAIIRYQLEDNGSIPSYITDGGYFLVGNNLIGIGSGGGTELSKSELLAYVMADHDAHTYITVDATAIASLRGTNMSDSEVTTMVNDWCTARGIS